ncbi:unnamed protein product [Prorocentrum cordatum]|uniref:Integrase catalytic domain-containing protein n=1 Tax=Prorocentrum cordatum TaxID=2364126 RepID=A0ABN9V3Z6_9DINO|nr:unnamed protein product [Polarella glacialis]
MKRMLTAAGGPPKVIQMVDDIVDTCRVCRLWMKGGNKPTTTVKLSTEFNDEVQVDLLFYKRRVVGHLCDGCMRFTVARELTDRTLESLLDFIWAGWIQMFGPMAVLTVDGEGAMASEEAGVALGRMGTTRKLKAPGQHAQVVEPHHEILRKQLHLIDAQCRESEIKVPFARRLAEAVYVKNAFLTIGQGTPYKDRKLEIGDPVDFYKPGEAPKGFEHLGWAIGSGGWTLTKISQKCPHVVAAMFQVAFCGLHLNGVVAARVGKKVPTLPGLHDFEFYTMCWWLPRRQGKGDTGVEAMCYGEGVASEHLSLRQIFGEKDWSASYFMQLLTVGPDVLDVLKGKAPQEVANEEVNAEEERDESLDELFSIEAMWNMPKDSKEKSDEEDIMEYAGYLTEEPDTSMIDRTDVIKDYDILEAWVTQEANYGKMAADIQESLQPEKVIGFAAEAWKMLNEPRITGEASHEDDMVILSFYDDGTAKAVIERDENLLTAAEKTEHREAVRAARLKELRHWAGFKAMSRISRKSANNLIDAKWVDKWKWTQASDGTMVRIIRCRLTVRMTFEEVAKLLNESIRDICFELPKGTAELLCEVEGFEGFNTVLEVLHMEKGGFGLNDAPRLFGLRRDQVLLSVGLRATHADPHLWLKHEGKVLTLVASTHLDDLKCAGRDKARDEMISALEAVFGKMAMHEKSFVHCGLRHRQLDDVSIEVDQIEYVKNLSCIDEKGLQGLGDEDDPPAGHVNQYPSLLGAIAWRIMTRIDIYIYVAALQRHGKAPKVGHIKKMNVLLKYMKEHPLALTTHKLKLPLSDGCDYLLLLAGFMTEIQGGELDARQLRDMVDGAEGCMVPALPLEACVDAQSVFSGITAEQVRIPEERHTLYHAQWVRELLDRLILRTLWWIDTRTAARMGLPKEVFNETP